MIEECKNLPDETITEILGFHPNARITKDINESDLLTKTLQYTQEGITNTSQDKNENTVEFIKNLEKDIP
jgi:hypothetical protein